MGSAAGRDEILANATQDDALLAAAKVMVAFSVQAVDEVGDRISPAQLRTLTVLEELGTANLAEVSARLGIVTSATSRLCDRLVDAGLVLRGPAPHTRREVLLRISAAGRRLLAEVNERRLLRLRAALGTLPAARRRTVIRALRSFADAAHPMLHPDIATPEPPNPGSPGPELHSTE